MLKNFRSTESIWVGQKIEGCCIYASEAFCQLLSAYFISVSSLMKAVGLTITFLCSEHIPRISLRCRHSITASLGLCNSLKPVHSLIHRLCYHFYWNCIKVERKKLITHFRPTLPLPRSVSQDKLQDVTLCTRSLRKERWISQAKTLQQENLTCQIALTHHSKV